MTPARGRRLSQSDMPLCDNTVSRHDTSTEALKRPQPLDTFDIANETPTTGSDRTEREKQPA